MLGETRRDRWLVVIMLALIACLLVTCIAGSNRPKAQALTLISPVTTPRTWSTPIGGGVVELTPPFRPTPTGALPPPVSNITPIPHQKRGDARSGVAVVDEPVTPTATRTAMLVQIRARVSVGVMERRMWEVWRRHNRE